MNNPLNQRTSPESICLKAFMLVLAQRANCINIYGKPGDPCVKEEEETTADQGLAVARKGNIHRCHIDLMAMVIQGMGYSGDQGGDILDFFRTRVV